MRYISKVKKAEEPPPIKKPPVEDKHLKVLEKLQKVVEGAVKERPVRVSIDEPISYKKTVNDLSGLLITSIKANEKIVKIHAAQIGDAISEMRKTPKVERYQRMFHMDVNRDSKGLIESVDGVID